MNTTKEYQITDDLTAHVEDEDTTLTINSVEHDDYDVYRLGSFETADGEEPYWEMTFDSLSAKSDTARLLWEKSDFYTWANSFLESGQDR